MKFRGYAVFLSALAVMAYAVPVLADKVPDPPSTDPIEVTANCDLTGYKSGEQVLQPPVSIPDNVAAGVTVGPIVIPADGSLISDVILELQATHTWVGDLVVTLGYDVNCDQQVDAAVRVVCRPRGTQASGPPPCGTQTGTFGCSSNLVAANVLRFTDNVATTLAEGACPGDAVNIVPGCYKTSIAGGALLANFAGRPKGGCWFLNVSDNAGADTGTISRWAVHLLNSPTANSTSSWGSVKTLYR
jgi:hypothetical protein